MVVTKEGLGSHLNILARRGLTVLTSHSVPFCEIKFMEFYFIKKIPGKNIKFLRKGGGSAEVKEEKTQNIVVT